MPITGSQHAPTVARWNVARWGATRWNYYQPWMSFSIDGVTQTGNVRMIGCSVQENAEGTPWTCHARVEGFTPLPGNDIKIYMGDDDASHRLFAGLILTVSTTLEPLSSIVVHDLDCVDYSWELNKQKVMARWTSNSITAIVSSVISTWTRNFTVDVELGLDTIGEFTATNEDVSDILDRLAIFAGARWWVDGGHVVHFTTQAGEPTTEIRDGSEMHGWGLSLSQPIALSSTIAQRVTRFWVRGGGSPALVQVPVGATSIPVADATWYPETQDFQGGVGTQWTSMLESGTQRFNFGSTVRGSANGVTVAKCAGGSVAGATAQSVDDLTAFPDSGWVSVKGTVFRYTEKSSPTGAGYLDGIPAAGYGSLAVDTNTEDPVVLLSSIESVSSVTQVIPQGQDINILYDVADVPAMTDFQDDVGGANILDGRVDGFETDGRWGWEETKARALALLELRKNNHDTVTFTTRDDTMRVGREVTIALTTPPINGTYKIQSVSVSEIGGRPVDSTVFPLRQVTASNERFTIERLLRRLRKVT